MEEERLGERAVAHQAACGGALRVVDVLVRVVENLRVRRQRVQLERACPCIRDGVGEAQYLALLLVHEVQMLGHNRLEVRQPGTGGQWRTSSALGRSRSRKRQP